MEIVLGTAVPFFAVLLCGLLATRVRLLDQSGVRGVNAFVFWFALPALLFGKVAQTPFERLADPGFYLLYESTSLSLYAVVLVALRVLGRTLPEAALAALGAVWGNTGYMGVPLLLRAYGEAAALPAVLAVVLDATIAQTLTVVLIEAGQRRQGGLAGTARAVATNPLILAVVLGFVVAASGLALPSPLRGFLELIGPASGPAALFALGATLARAPVGGDLPLVLGLSLVKLAAFPALLLLLLPLFELPEELREPVLINAALPTAATVFVLGQRYHVLERTTAALVFVSHLLGIFTLTALLVMLGG
jgi:predicted permease